MLPWTKLKGTNLEIFPSWRRKRCKHKVMGELVLVPGQRPRFKVAPVLQTTEHKCRNGGLSQAQLLQDVILSVYPSPHRDSALALKGLIWTFWNVYSFTPTVQRKWKGCHRVWRNSWRPRSAATVDDEASAAVCSFSCYAIFSWYLAELLQNGYFTGLCILWQGIFEIS